MKTIIKYMVASVLFFGVVGCESIFSEQPKNDPEAIFENLWTSFQEEYAPFEERNVDWEQAYSRFRPLVNPATSDDELFEVISDMLSELDDGHVSLTTPGREIYFANKIRREKIDDGLFDQNVIQNNYLENISKDADENYVYGKIKNENIGYVFFENVEDNFLVMNDFLNEFEDSKGIIIDLRHNDGGDFTWAFSEIGRLTDQRRYVFQSKTKNGKGKEDFTPWHEWFLEPSGKYLDIPIVVLTDRYTISAGERAVMAFMTIPNAITVGDTTNGAHGTMIGRELANGWYYSLVPQKVELFDGISYEGIGLAPDVYLKNTLEHVLQGKDDVLEHAIDRLRF